MADGAGGAPVVEVTTRKTSWIRRSVWFLAIFAVIAVVILGDFQAISAASSTIELPWRSSRRTEDVVIRVDMSKPGDPDEFRKMRDQYKAKKASQGASGGGDAAQGDPGQKREDAGPLNVPGAPDLATTGWVAWPPPNPPPSMRGAGGGGDPKDGGEPSNLGDEQVAYREASRKVDKSNPEAVDSQAGAAAADVDQAQPAAEESSSPEPRAPATLEKYGWVAWPPPNPPPAAA